MHKKVQIISTSFDPDLKLFNNCLVIHESCRHKPSYYRFSVDGAKDDERVLVTNRHRNINCYDNKLVAMIINELL